MKERKTFTQKEIKTLQSNPYVKRVTEKIIGFTVAFKEEFWRRYTQEYQSPRKIMIELGFDPDMLGKDRIDGIFYHIRNQFRSGEGFRDAQKSREVRWPQEAQLPPTKENLLIQHQLSYLQQEMEFIKKTILADNEARRKK